MTTLVSQANDWLKYWWMKIPEPRSYSIIYALAYGGAIVFGLFILLFPPQTLLGSAGEVTMTTMALLYIGGGTIGAFGGTREAWKFERIGVYSILLALTSYFVVIIHTAIHSTGFRYAQMLTIYLACLLMVTRLVMIWRYTYKPRIHTGEFNLEE